MSLYPMDTPLINHMTNINTISLSAMLFCVLLGLFPTVCDLCISSFVPSRSFLSLLPFSVSLYAKLVVASGHT